MDTNCNQLKMVSPQDGKKYLTDVANAEGIFRLIQSIPFPILQPLVLQCLKGCKGGVGCVFGGNMVESFLMLFLRGSLLRHGYFIF